MTLVERIEKLCERAAGQLSLEENRAESQRLGPLIHEARQFSANLGAEVQQVRLFQDQGMAVAGSANAEAAQKTLSRLRDRFAREPRAEQLTRGRDWTLLKEQIQATRKDLASTLDTEWRHFVDSSYSGDKPENLSSALAATDGNLNNLGAYRQTYLELRQSMRSRPESRQDFVRVEEFARKLAEIHQRLDFNVPDDVKRFLQAVAGGGADLDLLTGTVREWLKQQNNLRRYHIVSRMGQ